MVFSLLDSLIARSPVSPPAMAELLRRDEVWGVRDEDLGEEGVGFGEPGSLRELLETCACVCFGDDDDDVEGEDAADFSEEEAADFSEEEASFPPVDVIDLILLRMIDSSSIMSQYI